MVNINYLKLSICINIILDIETIQTMLFYIYTHFHVYNLDPKAFENSLNENANNSHNHYYCFIRLVLKENQVLDFKQTHKW